MELTRIILAGTGFVLLIAVMGFVLDLLNKE